MRWGYYTLLLSIGSYLTVGVDCSPGLIRRAKLSYKNKSNLEFLLMDALHLSFANNSFDAVTSFDVIEHIVDDEKFLDEIYRVLKPGGFILITTPNRSRISNLIRTRFRKKRFPHRIGRYPGATEDLYHEREYTTNELKNKLKNHGFYLEKVLTIFLGFSFCRGSLSIGLPLSIFQKFGFLIVAKARKPMVN